MLFYCNAKFNFLYGTMYSGSNYFFTTTKKTIFHKLLEKNKNNNKLFKKKKKKKNSPCHKFLSRCSSLNIEQSELYFS